uniref:Uncharacterized protein n=1 Tax=Cacopsylla melanoneura TaxID=428564 RepID=A0A8D8MCX2_9HEMI
MKMNLLTQTIFRAQIRKVERKRSPFSENTVLKRRINKLKDQNLISLYQVQRKPVETVSQKNKNPPKVYRRKIKLQKAPNLSRVPRLNTRPKKAFLLKIKTNL